jgi:hypothetical protein
MEPVDADGASGEPRTDAVTPLAETQRKRRSYRQPRLQVWGSIEDLTEGNVGGSADSGSSTTGAW